MIPAEDLIEQINGGDGLSRLQLDELEVLVSDTIRERTGWTASYLADFIFAWMEQNAALTIGRGRGQVYRVFLPGGVTAIVRKYYRGGFVRHFLKETFLRVPFTSSKRLRPMQEFAVLRLLESKGISVPSPVLAAVHYFRPAFYRGIIATVEIPAVMNFLELVVAQRKDVSDETIKKISLLAGREISRALDTGVFHPDFHLGNVLVSATSDRVWLIDFDRGKILPAGSDSSAYRRALLHRWQKSSAKHQVSDLVDSSFEAGLYDRQA